MINPAFTIYRDFYEEFIQKTNGGIKKDFKTSLLDRSIFIYLEMTHLDFSAILFNIERLLNDESSSLEEIKEELKKQNITEKKLKAMKDFVDTFWED